MAPSLISVVAHRGASAYAPENTMAAFRLALEMNADAFELDVRLTKDGELVVIHDPVLERTTDGAGPVAMHTLAALKCLDAGSWKGTDFAGERVPTLAEALAFAKDTIGVYIEIKDCGSDDTLLAALIKRAAHHQAFDADFRREALDMIESSRTPNLELTRKTADIIRSLHMAEQVVVQSFSAIVCAIVLTEAPDVPCFFIGGCHDERPEQWDCFLRAGRFLGVHGFSVHYPCLTGDVMRSLKADNRTVAAWAVDDVAAIRRVAALGVDAIITNRPDVCRRTLASNS
ncbi:MAG TPA: hypothetical protein HPP83_06500 [Candidatus Hydrogenedentes bacterium]|nr:hypothetical protein [Candidatus Hydrogenedentota bacterium]